MPKTGENIYKRKDGRWEARFIKGRTPEGKARYGYLYGKTYREVKEKQRHKLALFTEGKNTALDLNRLAALWLEANGDRFKEATLVKYHHLLAKHILPQLGRLTAQELTASRLGEFVQFKLTQGRLDQRGGLSRKSVADLLSLIKSIIAHGQVESAAQQVKVPALPSKRKAYRVLSAQDERRLTQYLLADLDCCRLGVLVCLYTGIRLGELCALKWGDILWEEKILSISRTMQRLQDLSAEGSRKTKIIITAPKSLCAVREIPLPEFLLPLLAQFAAAGEAFILSGEARRYVEPRTMQNRFQTYLRAAGVEAINFHGLRHTFATRCVEAGFEIKSLSEILGHASTAITLNQYVHSSMNLKRANMALLKAPFGQ